MSGPTVPPTLSTPTRRASFGPATSPGTPELEVREKAWCACGPVVVCVHTRRVGIMYGSCVGICDADQELISYF